MDERRLVMIGVGHLLGSEGGVSQGVVLAVSTITLLAVTLSAKTTEDDTAENYNASNPLLLISLDGFRSDYIYRHLPTLETLAKEGVTARFMMPSYPTITFPNHYTIVTGLYPESHGIVANRFYDQEFEAIFTMGVKDGKWWGGEPIWNTLTRQNKTSATFFWPGSDTNINDQRPTEWRLFDDTVPFTDRVDQVSLRTTFFVAREPLQDHSYMDGCGKINSVMKFVSIISIFLHTVTVDCTVLLQVVEWLSRSEDRPDWVSLYFEEPDHSGHGYGPDSIEVANALSHVDGMISRLLDGLRRNDMEDKVNIIVLADHGMARAGPLKLINLTNYVPDFYSSSVNNTYGAFTMLRLQDSSDEAVNGMVKQLACPSGVPYMRAYKPQDLPTRFHYSNNRRIGDIVLDFDSGFFTTYQNGSILKGEHGYDNHLSTMSALFIATGPDFKKEVVLEPFQNIEIYNLMCHLTGVDPAPNNGTEGSLYAALINPPPTPEVPLEDELPAPEYPTNLTNLLTMADCIGDLDETEYQTLGLNMNKTVRDELVKLHLPWGNPLSGNLSADVLLLHQKDHVTGYSKTLKMPLWVSFTVSELLQGSPVDDTLWLSDVRLNASNTATCTAYKNLTQEVRGVSMYPLFHPLFSASSTLPKIPYLVSNAVPMYNTLIAEKYMAYFSKLDKTTDFLPMNIPRVPSDIFVVLTRCRQVVGSLGDCNEEDLDAIAFIHPNLETEYNNNCLDNLNYETLFLATVRDVELATGLTLFADLQPSSIRLQLALRIHMHTWPIYSNP
ncbi:Venom phosphodiesterase 2 [Chionoecetes opilio]|uniref:Venom phosphodiesterase 2 n=1 Tax=Chionoecetes opilio TaxID=41210 RepID=A0A8J4YCH1_CHIOP|nr:Venom phosphodiesterase 2 [Chionoecetes opilio]